MSMIERRPGLGMNAAPADILANPILHWCWQVIEGSGGEQDYEYYEMATANYSERVTTAAWMLRCLADPECPGSAEILRYIQERREKLSKL